VAAPTRLEDLSIRQPRIKAPRRLEPLASTSTHDRAFHSYGSSYRDVVRGFRGEFDCPPDVVFYPTSEEEIEAILDWCQSARIAAIPYGGGTSVVGGVEAPRDNDWAGVVSIDMSGFGRVLEVDRDSVAARMQAGITGPALEADLRSYGLTLRHYPQSFEYSTVGGWLATRAGGHFATLHTHIDDFVESIRAITPTGVWQSRRLPASGAGPSPDRLLIGSEGILGVITEAWLRVQPVPAYRASASVAFDSFEDGWHAVREVAQSYLWPSNLRLLDAREAALTAGQNGHVALLLLGFESCDQSVEPQIKRAVEVCAGHGGRLLSGIRSQERDGGSEANENAQAFRSAFFQAPYIRDTLVAAGILTETFETVITWDRFEEFHAQISHRAAQAVAQTCGDGCVMCRLTHVYPDGAAPYYTVLCPARRGSELSQWDTVKQAVSEAIVESGGTITHHHAVGRDHRRWYDRQRPDPFARSLQAAKQALDPSGVLNPGVLIDHVSSTQPPQR
jgi:alkyldihydroxyacetonephosphate synthase